LIGGVLVYQNATAFVTTVKTGFISTYAIVGQVKEVRAFISKFQRITL
jgi:hypothetical protein